MPQLSSHAQTYVPILMILGESKPIFVLLNANCDGKIHSEMDPCLNSPGGKLLKTNPLESWRYKQQASSYLKTLKLDGHFMLQFWQDARRNWKQIHDFTTKSDGLIQREITGYVHLSA